MTPESTGLRDGGAPSISNASAVKRSGRVPLPKSTSTCESTRPRSRRMRRIRPDAAAAKPGPNNDNHFATPADRVAHRPLFDCAAPATPLHGRMRIRDYGPAGPATPAAAVPRPCLSVAGMGTRAGSQCDRVLPADGHMSPSHAPLPPFECDGSRGRASSDSTPPHPHARGPTWGVAFAAKACWNRGTRVSHHRWSQSEPTTRVPVSHVLYEGCGARCRSVCPTTRAIDRISGRSVSSNKPRGIPTQGLSRLRARDLVADDSTVAHLNAEGYRVRCQPGPGRGRAEDFGTRPQLRLPGHCGDAPEYRHVHPRRRGAGRRGRMRRSRFNGQSGREHAGDPGSTLGNTGHAFVTLVSRRRASRPTTARPGATGLRRTSRTTPGVPARVTGE